MFFTILLVLISVGLIPVLITVILHNLFLFDKITKKYRIFAYCASLIIFFFIEKLTIKIVPKLFFYFPLYLFLMLFFTYALKSIILSNLRISRWVVAILTLIILIILYIVFKR